MKVSDRVNMKLKDYYKKHRIWVTVKGKFDAAHHIKGHPKCGRTHGHTFKVHVHVMPKGFLDFAEIHFALDEVLVNYDHRNLGNITSEEIAKEILEKMSKKFSSCSITVDLYETEKYGIRLRNW